ncbi:hypothetical protein KHM83_00215 [Fusibacter paucivorans]|uniref:Uncharacterized protein n=1 Tax=Fusibacter paucivorans TaxID=76009 RepID=A0ABS5PJ24_9FIRM|nr:hypothetical protein [Fusibacter paucivorans]MBS7525090.1 hypothetical protein [Fusibacter paucivorans]MDK2868394.1 hypothetical protein [Clostridiales bacterium]
MDQHSDKRLAEVWGDTVVLKELFIASVLGIVLTMAGYILGRSYFGSIEGLDVGLQKGYSLMVGILGCVVSAVISAKLFKPKRIVDEQFENDSIEEIVKFAGMSMAEEIEAIKDVDPEIVAELEALQLKAMLDLRNKG